MKIINLDNGKVNELEIDLDKACTVFIFKDDNEMNQLLGKCAEHPVKTEGLRLLKFMPDDMQGNPIILSLFKSVIDMMDGISTTNFEERKSEMIDAFQEVLDNDQIAKDIDESIRKRLDDDKNTEDEPF